MLLHQHIHAMMAVHPLVHRLHHPIIVGMSKPTGILSTQALCLDRLVKDPAPLEGRQ